MSAGYTPGPWAVWSSLYDGMAAAVVRDVDPLETIAEIRDHKNANLTAAAPTMAGYIQRKAEEGDPEAAEIMEVIHGRRD